MGLGAKSLHIRNSNHKTMTILFVIQNETFDDQMCIITQENGTEFNITVNTFVALCKSLQYR